MFQQLPGKSLKEVFADVERLGAQVEARESNPQVVATHSRSVDRWNGGRRNHGVSHVPMIRGSAASLRRSPLRTQDSNLIPKAPFLPRSF
jgi:hypothetical protein